jgi:ParB family chromosome partitioning protein
MIQHPVTHLPLSTLHLSKTNMNFSEKNPDLSDILPSIRKRGILQPLLVRPNDVGHAIEAGRRRFLSAEIVAKEIGEDPMVPVLILQDCDDAGAIEASLIENVARQTTDEMKEYATYSKLISEGRTAEDIAETFGLEVKQVEKRLALGNLLPRIRELFSKQEIDVDTIRALTVASKRQQKEWLALFAKGNAPQGRQVRTWACGGQQISTKCALFDPADYQGEKATDLFEEREYFLDAEQFWQLQNAAIAAKRDGFLERGWQGVEVFEIGQHFETWKYQKVAKTDGGKVYIVPGRDGSVSIYDGYLSEAEAKRGKKARQEDTSEATAVAAPKTARPELTSWQSSYVDAHQQAAVRAALVGNPGVAFRLFIAQAIGFSSSVHVTEDHLGKNGQDIADSVSALQPHQKFEQARKDAKARLRIKDSIGLSDAYVRDKAAVFDKLMKLSDKEVMRLAAVLMAEALVSGDEAVGIAGKALSVDLAGTWTADEPFWSSLRDKQVINAMLAEVAGKAVADANLTATGKVQKGVLQDALAGSNGRTKAGGWLPKWLTFPGQRYTKRDAEK